MIMQMTKELTVYQLSFLPRFFPVNCYLVEEEDDLTLIDTALPYSKKAILQAARRIGKSIGRIVLTHAHSDHIGALDALAETLPGVPIYISQRDSRLLAGDVSLDPNEPNTPIRGGVAKPGKVMAKPDVMIAEGDRIGSLEAIAAPGHTPGMTAFLDTRNHALIAGDAFQIRGGIAVSGKLQPWFPFTALATWHKKTALESAKKLLGLRPSLLAVGHGHMLRNPEEAMKRAITEAAALFAGGKE